jgi:hypothetical protein
MVRGSFMSRRDLQAARDREANVPSTTTLLSGNKSPRALRDASDSEGSISLVAAPLIGSCGYVSSRVPDILRTSRCGKLLRSTPLRKWPLLFPTDFRVSWLRIAVEIGFAYAMEAESNFFWLSQDVVMNIHGKGTLRPRFNGPSL